MKREKQLKIAKTLEKLGNLLVMDNLSFVNSDLCENTPEAVEVFIPTVITTEKSSAHDLLGRAITRCIVRDTKRHCHTHKKHMVRVLFFL